MSRLAIIGFVLTWAIGCRSHDDERHGDVVLVSSPDSVRRISPMGAPMPGVNPGDEMRSDEATVEVAGGIADMHTVPTIGASKGRPPGPGSSSTRNFDKLMRSEKPIASKAPASSMPRYDVPEPY